MFPCSGAEVSDCGRYLIMLIVKDCRDNLLFFADLKENGEIKEKLKIKQIIYKFESDYEVGVVMNRFNQWSICFVN